MKSGGRKDKIVGYKVITANLLVGAKVYKRGEFIPAPEAGSELAFVYDMKLVEPVYESEGAPNDNTESSRMRSNSFAFKRPL